MNRISIEGTSYIFGDMRTQERVACCSCAEADDLLEKRVLLVRDGGATEIFYCLACWNRRPADFSWVGVRCLLVFTAGGLSGSSAINEIVHGVLGTPFNCLRPVEDGIFLYCNPVKCEQPNLF